MLKLNGTRKSNTKWGGGVVICFEAKWDQEEQHNMGGGGVVM